MSTALSNDAILEAIGGKTVVELSELIEAFKTKFNVSIVAAASAPAAGGAAAAVEEQTEFTVILKEGGAKKINVIKVIRSLTTLGLAEAKAAAENPGTLLEAVSKEAATDAKSKLEAEGAVIEVKPA